MTFGCKGSNVRGRWSTEEDMCGACIGVAGSLGAQLDARASASAGRRTRVTSMGRRAGRQRKSETWTCMHPWRELPGCTGIWRYFGASVQESKGGSFGKGAAALGQPVGAMAYEEKPGGSSGLDWSLNRNSWFKLNVELSIYARKWI
ncbi:hypothetical protein CRG98_037628 [Punica granatum]|uniref:Uncharacterized protein n=1 Tax=Punica granatum TaxID=22663 RepID=A0A2I0IEC1_PUNGR|nr:hypothetical protein CRG98_037628 [Punica granatum]